MSARMRIVIAGIVGVCLGSAAVAAPEPSVVPKSWTLEFDYVDPQPITVQLPGYAKPRKFWYMLYTVTNNTGREVQFLPRFELMTNTMRVVPGDPGVHPMVFEAIKKLHRPTHPFLVEPVKIMGKVLQGEDNAKSSVVIWPQFDIKANRFTVYAGGLSGESVLMRNPNYQRGKLEYAVKKPRNGSEIRIAVNPKFFTLRKTMAIEYVLPGDAKTRAQARVGRLGTRWVMR